LESKILISFQKLYIISQHLKALKGQIINAEPLTI